jgi:hypothetical protein
MGVSYVANEGQARIIASPVEEGYFSSERAWRKASALLRRTGRLCRMTEELDFVRRKRVDGRAGKSAPARPLKRADLSGRTVTREALDVARYITDMTAQLEAMAIAARLDLLAYFLGMAKAESEIYVRTNAVAEAEDLGEEPYEPADGLPQESSSFD